MNLQFKQDTRLGKLTTVLGKDVLSLLRFTGSDHLNGLFEYAVEAVSGDADINFDQVLGTHATIKITTDHGPRHFDGIVTQARWSGTGENGHRYALTLQPWFWLASRRRNQRIFHKMTVVEIIQKLLSPYAGLGQPALKLDLTESYPTLEYTVQYRESDMHFALRLMERFGITYRFDHEPGSHTLVLTDTVFTHPKIVGGDRLYKPHDGTEGVNEEHMWAWHADRRLTTGAVRLTDYNFKNPTAAMEVDRIGDAAYSEGQIESYDYPGDYLLQGDGKDVVERRVKQERGQDERHHAIGDCVSLASGMTLKLSGDHAPKDTYLCLSATHEFTSEGYGSTVGGSEDHGYTGRYVLMPTSTPLAPSRKTHIPKVQGPQTAVVVGDGEIDCDEYGRILVHFHWDLEKAYSMRCRVSQNWASKGWGGMVIPRIGMEVVVEFLEGDPDKPLVTGCVYNGKNDVPYPLPQHKTRSTFKTDTHKGAGFNELRFEDEAGSEEIFVHAQKDRNTKVENNQSERVNANKVESVGHSMAVEVGNNFYEIVDGDMELRVGPANKGTYTPGGADKHTQGIGSVPDMLGKPGSARKGIGDLKISVEKSKTQVIGQDHFEVVEGDKETDVRQNYTVKARKKIKIEAGDEILLVCGKSRIKLSDNGTIEVNGQKIMVLGDKLVSVQSDTIKLN